MRKADGYTQIVGAPGSVKFYDGSTGQVFNDAEADTFVCGHCQKIVHVPPYTDPASVGGGCRLCQRNICPTCVDKGLCVPWEEMIARMEARRSYGF